MSEFDYLFSKEKYREIYKKCETLQNCKDTKEKAKAARKLLETLVDFVYENSNKVRPETATLLELIDNAFFVNFVNNQVILESLHYVRKLGINAEHDEKIKKTQVALAYENIIFFTQYVYKKFEEPETVKAIVLPKHMSEADTRKIYIDLYLNEAGWEVVEPTGKTTLSGGQEVVSGSVIPGKACCEIEVDGMNNKSGIGFCDYVLYGKDGKPLAIVEAKKTSTEALVGCKQVKEYGECMKARYGYVPVLYYTNGYEIYVMDGLYPSRRVMVFHSMDELEYMIQKRKRNDITDLKINDEISGRPYQKMAITSVCERFNNKFRRSLIVMATGTGKTRVAISLVEVLLRNKWIKNVLFLADRTSLVKQAFNNFKKILDKMTYCVLNDRKLADDPNARVTFSTHQTMIGYIDAEEKEFTSGRFDLIIIDEAHRSIFNKYSSIFEYFDALLVGLTATPKAEVDANTYQIFNCESGEPNFSYSLEEAVREKYLVPYRLYKKTTKLLDRGIKYSELTKEDQEKADSILLVDGIEDYQIPRELLFKLFYNVDTCSKVLDDLMENGLRVDGGQKIGKTIIFAYNHLHADLIVNTFRENYPSLGENYCQLIDNKVKGATDLITDFEEKDEFRIAVSVDMLDTGIDVPSVLNLVFFKPVKSKIKFVQMIGRGTRLCEGLIDGKDKDHFLIFDYCGNFEYFDEHPEGAENANGKSLSQKLFDVRLDIMVELQRYEYQSVELYKAYYEKLKSGLFRKVQAIKDGSSRIAVRKEMDYVDKYIDADQWISIAPLSKKEIQLHLSKLIDNEVNQDPRSLRFDMLMLDIELAILAKGGIGSVIKNVESVRTISRLLLDTAASVKSVYEKAESLKALVSVEFWNNPTISKLEQYREDVRELLKHLPPKVAPVIIDTDDEVLDLGQGDSPLIDIRTYKEKVIDYLADHLDNETINKIKTMEQIDANDLKELERILWCELGTQDDYKSATDIENLAVFIRSIVGIDQKTINEKFGDFLNDNVLNSAQQEFIKAIIDYVRENGDIEAEDLIEKSPFDTYDILELFGNNITYVTKVVNSIHQSVMVA